jgi:membrane protein required for colicin V production
MQPYDVAMIVVLAVATLLGIWKGAAWQVASLASIIVSSMVAVHSSAAIAPYFPGQEPWNRFLAMLVLYVVTAIAIWLLFHFVSGIIDRVKLKEFDRQLGAIVGLAKGALYCVVITFFAVTLSEPARRLVLVSKSGDIIARGIKNAYPILPEDIRGYLGKYIDEFNAKMSEPPTTAPTVTGVPDSLPSPTSTTTGTATVPNSGAGSAPPADKASKWRFW